MADKPLLADADAVEAGRVQNEPLAPGDISEATAKRFRPTLHIAYICCVLCFIDLSIVSPTLYPYVSKMCGSTALYGYLMMAFSGCQVIASPAFNTWAVKRTVKEALLVALLCLLVGNLVYALAAFTLEDTCELPNASVCAPLFVYQNITQGGVTSPSKRTLADVGACGSDRQMGLLMLFLGRAIAGFGGGVVSVSFGMFSRVTRLKERVQTFGIARSWMALAYMLAPGVAAFFTVAKCSCDSETGLQRSAYFNQYTLPGFFTAFVAFLVFLLALFKFKNPPSLGERQVVKVFINRGLATLLLMSFVASFTVGAFSSILVPVTSHDYDWQNLLNSLFFVAIGFLLIPGSVLAMMFSKIISPRSTIVVFALVLILGLLMNLFPNAEATWQSYIPFFLGSVFICTGYSAITAICPATFSMMIPNSHKQAMMSWMPSLNAVGRTLGPLYGVQSYVFATNYGGNCESSLPYTLICGDRFTQLLLAILIMLATATVFFAWHHLDVTPPASITKNARTPIKSTDLLKAAAPPPKQHLSSFMRSTSNLLMNTGDMSAIPTSPPPSGRGHGNPVSFR